MYGAKTNGKRGYATFEPEMHLKVRSRHELATALAHAASRGEIEVRYQPIVSLGAGGTVAFEALARWRHPVRGLLAPAAFVPLAEEIGEIGAIGRVVLRAACERTREWGDAFPQHGELAVAVNLSATELQDPDLPGDVAAILAACGLPAHRLVLELTESGAMRDPDLTAETFAKLRALGVRLALDDFGTGYSSLSHLRDLPIDMLKIAKPFVDPLDDATADTTFVATILRLAEALDLDVVAEGIERAEQADALRLLRCGLGQGFHFARPLDERRAKARLASTGTSGLPESAVA
jgi:EAL domain-containing protein (putative c-di-GMP-specific phosphodiesterase class I)